jgi:hypothetical protein
LLQLGREHFQCGDGVVRVDGLLVGEFEEGWG